MKTISECAAHYAAQWADLDQPLFSGLAQANTEERRLSTLGSLCGKYKIARSLRRAYDLEAGMPRYMPLLKLIDQCVNRHPTPKCAEEVVLWFRDEVSSCYGGVQALSLSSKVLWFVYRSPVIIYDKLARVALESPTGDYRSYERSWNARFDRMEQEIAVASAPHSSERWFHERVFDIYLWHIGQEKIEQGAQADGHAFGVPAA